MRLRLATGLGGEKFPLLRVLKQVLTKQKHQPVRPSDSFDLLRVLASSRWMYLRRFGLSLYLVVARGGNLDLEPSDGFLGRHLFRFLLVFSCPGGQGLAVQDASCLEIAVMVGAPFLDDLITGSEFLGFLEMFLEEGFIVL